MNINKSNSEYILRWAKKYKAVEHLGGECKECGEPHLAVLDFHHLNDKHKNITELIFERKLRWSDIENELKKCELLCSRCHRIRHYKESYNNSKDRKRNNNKKIILEYKNICKCSICGYDENISALDFHHMDDKSFEVSTDINIRLKSLNDLTKTIQDELDKCVVICSNCHRKEHLDLDKLNSFMDEIIRKSKSYVEKKIIDHEIIKQMIKDGYSQSKIRKELDLSKGTVNYIYHKILNEK